MTFSPKLSLFPEGVDEPGSSSHAPERLGGLEAQVPGVLSAEVGQFMVFEVAEDILRSIEFRGVGREQGGWRRADYLPIAASVDLRTTIEDVTYRLGPRPRKSLAARSSSSSRQG